MNWPPFFRLPNVENFFDAVQNVLCESTEWRLRDRGRMASDRFMSVDYVGNDFVGKDLGFVLCSFPYEPSKVQLTMHATRWFDDRSHPSDHEYLSAERMTDALFRQAGKVLKRRIRLCRPRRRKGLVGKLAVMFNGFCFRSTDHWTRGKPTHLHQTEHEDFYRFICAAHRCGSALMPEEVFAELKHAGFNDKLSKELTEQYEAGRRILAIGTWRWHRTSFDAWNPWNAREDRKNYRARQREKHAEERRRFLSESQ